MSLDDCTEHTPMRLYVWKLAPEDVRSLYATCRDCKSDYQVPNDEIVRLCAVPDTPNIKPFHEMFREACALYRLNVKNDDRK